MIIMMICVKYSTTTVYYLYDKLLHVTLDFKNCPRP